ncbi:MAG: SDR family oxidoreductase [Dehalococcoidia bacterium]
MELGLAGKTVIVTGGGSNIGRGISLAFAGEKSNVVIAEIDPGQGEKVAAEGSKLGGKCTCIPTDVTDWDSVQAMVKKAVDTFGTVDVLVNNVGWTFERLFIEKPREEWEKEIQLNLWGMINCTRAVLDYMIAQKGGSIVSLGSDAGRMGEYREAVYAGCKGAVISITKTLAREVGRYSIRLNVVCPGTTMPDNPEEEVGSQSMWGSGGFGASWNTPEIRERIAKVYPLRRIGTGQDIGKAVVFLASDAASFITGQTLSVSGGYTMM